MSSLLDIKEIQQITFGIFSTEELTKLSVCKIDNTKLSGPNSVYDERMGCITDNGKSCITCGKNYKQCCGHAGHIELNESILHPLFYKQIVLFLRCFCNKCYRLLLTRDHLLLNGFLKFTGEKRFKKIVEKIEKTELCCHCDSPQPKIAYNSVDNIISMVYKEKSIEKSKKDNKVNIVLSVEDIRKIFDNIVDEDVELCGFDIKLMHPKNLIMEVFSVLPTIARPFLISDGNVCDDDLTNQLIEIIKANNILKKEVGEIIDEKKEQKRQKALQTLKFRISTFMNNSTGKAKHPTNSRPIKGLKERIAGKDGIIRNNLMGKRVNHSGRTVISPDPNLPFGYVGIPIEVSKELTYPEKVNKYNINLLTYYINNHKANFVIKKNGGQKINLKYALNQQLDIRPTDIILRGIKKIPYNSSVKIEPNDKIIRNGKILDFLTKKNFKLELGDEVHRHLRDGDMVLLNRQPTLHIQSMQAMKVKIRTGKTFSFSPNICTPFNSDFDQQSVSVEIDHCRKQGA